MSNSPLYTFVPPTGRVVGYGVCEDCQTTCRVTRDGLCEPCAVDAHHKAAAERLTADLRWVSHTQWCTLTVRTEGGTYTMVKRPCFVVLVADDGQTARGASVRVVNGQAWLMDVTNRVVAKTGRVTSVYVLEN